MRPRTLVEGLTTGLVLMAVFTPAWAANTLSVWPGAPGWGITAAAGAAGVWFVGASARRVRAPGVLRDGCSAEDKHCPRRRARTFGAVLGQEGVATVVAPYLLRATRNSDLGLPVLALIVVPHS